MQKLYILLLVFIATETSIAQVNVRDTLWLDSLIKTIEHKAINNDSLFYPTYRYLKQKGFTLLHSLEFANYYAKNTALNEFAFPKIIDTNSIMFSNPVLFAFKDSMPIASFGLIDTVSIDIMKAIDSISALTIKNQNNIMDANDSISSLQATNINSSIIDTNLIEVTEKIVNDIYLSTFAIDIDTLTAKQIDVLMDIAYQNPSEYGMGVYGARVLLGVNVDITFTDTISQTTKLSEQCDSTLNLVPNPGFEEKTTCHLTLSDTSLYVKNWFNPHTFIPDVCPGSTPDYFHLCFGPYPIQPRSDSAVIGLYTLQVPFKNAHEYFEVELFSPLIKDRKYRLNFYVQLDAASIYATNKIGAYFSDTLIKYPCTTPYLLPFIPQVVNNPSNFLTSKTSWTLVSETFIAKGGEQYMILGNFFPDSLSYLVYVGGGSLNGAYYIFDDVSLYCIGDSNSSVIEHTEETTFMVYPNPNNGAVTLSYNLPQQDKAIFEVYNVMGKKVFNHALAGGIQHEEVTMQLPNGIYFYRVQTPKGNKAKGRLMIIK